MTTRRHTLFCPEHTQTDQCSVTCRIQVARGLAAQVDYELAIADDSANGVGSAEHKPSRTPAIMSTLPSFP